MSDRGRKNVLSPASIFRWKLPSVALAAAFGLQLFPTAAFGSDREPSRPIGRAPEAPSLTRPVAPPATDPELVEKMAADHRNRGIVHAAAGRHDLAIQEYNVSLKLDPNQSYTYFKRGLAYANQAHYERAVEDYSEAIRLHPEAVQGGDGQARAGDTADVRDSHLAAAYLNRAAAYNKMGFFDWAIEDTTAATHLRPDFSSAYHNRGSFYLTKGEFDRAAEDYSKAIDLQPRFGDAYNHRGHARFFLGRFEDAAGDFRQRARIDPADAASSAWLYLALERSGQSGKEELARRAASMDLTRWPGPVLALFLGHLTPAQMMDDMKRLEGRERPERECEAAFYLGQFHLLQGRLEEARRHFRAAVDFGFFTFVEHIGAKAELQRMNP